jgi:RNA polymerase sigma factor (sigma-70 family)
MTDDRNSPEDPIIRRIQQAFAHEEPATELPEVLRRAAGYLAAAPEDTGEQGATGRGLTMADLTAARRREPAAVSRLYSAYAPPLFRFFLAAVGDRPTAEDLTGSVFAAAVEGLHGFAGPVEALPGWLYRIARHDLLDYRRRQARSRVARLGDVPDERAQAVQAVLAVLDRGGAVPRAMLLRALQPLLDMGDRATDAPLNRLSPREREVLALLGRGWSNAQIGRELYISPHTVRTHVQNILQKLEMHSRIGRPQELLDETEVAASTDDPDELAIQRLGGRRVRVALQELPPDQRDVLLLRLAGGLTAPEVAAVLGKTTGAVKALQHRGLGSLARVLSRPGPESEDAAATPWTSGWLQPPPTATGDTPRRDVGPTARADGE